MAIYKNLNGSSGVESYKIGSDFIRVRFDKPTKSHGCNTYLYTYNMTGRENVEQMKKFAEQGSGLGGFISSNRNDIEFESRSYTAFSL
ncbi:MAG: hypothetical protein AAB410_03045 [Patescibacteria group bacterium]